MEYFHGRKRMDMNMRVHFFNTLKNFTIIGNIPVRKKSSLDAYFCSIHIDSFFCFFENIRNRQDVPVLLLECAEFAGANASVRKIDVPVHDVCDRVSDSFFPEAVSKGE